MNDIDQSLKGDDLIDNQVIEFAETCANNRIHALTESLSDLRKSHNELQNEYDSYIRDTEELLTAARAESSVNDALKKSLLDMVGLKLPMSDNDVIELLRYVLTASAKFYGSRVSLTDTVNALSEIREQMLLDDAASPKQVVTSVHQYLNLNGHLLNVIDDVTTQRLGSPTQRRVLRKFDFENCSPEEALAERVRVIRELGENAEMGARFREMFDDALKAVKDNAQNQPIQESADDED